MPQNDNAVIGEKYVELTIHNCKISVYLQPPAAEQDSAIPPENVFPSRYLYRRSELFATRFLAFP